MENEYLTYAYTTLPAGAFVRYMVLQPGAGDEPLSCTLHTVCLDDLPDFEAISYVWGDSCRDQVILCGQERIYITTSLRDALLQVRLPSQPRALWADSICIHQANKIEQGHQVGLMGQIYTRARRTLVCLGEDIGGGGTHVLCLMSKVIDLIDQLPQRAHYNRDTYPYVQQDDPIMFDIGWSSIKALIEHPWFRRLWVVQEAALAPQVLLHWGLHRINWDLFLRVIIYAAALAPTIIGRWSQWLPDLHLLRLTNDLDSLPQALRNYTKTFKLGMIDMMRQGRALGVAEERDRIYAVLGLARMFPQGQRSLDVVPVYTRPAHEIFREFAEVYLQLTGDVDILNCVEHDEQSLVSRSPSWVPLWKPCPDLVRSLRGFHYLYSMSNEISKPVVMGNGRLKLRGVFLDHIQFVSSPCNHKKSMATQAAQVWNNLQVSKHRSVYSTANVPLAFTWTMGGGKRLRLSTERVKELEAQYLCELQRQGAQLNGGSLKDIESRDGINPTNDFGTMVSNVSRNRRFIMSERGYFGLGPRAAQEGDLCCIIFGSKCPFVLRQTNTKAEYQLVGDIYLTAETSNASWSGQFGPERGFTLLGQKNGKDWVEWGLVEQDIILR